MHRLILLCTLLCLTARTGAQTLLFEDFDDGFAGWETSGNVQLVGNPAIGANSARLKGNGVLTRTVSTSGFSGISIDWTMAAGSLEKNDSFVLEIDTGTGWTTVARLVNGEDDRVFRSGSIDLGADANDNPNLQIRYRILGAAADYGYAENTTVRAGGGGGGGRTELTYDQLTSGPGNSSPANDSALARPASSEPPLHTFEGRLLLQSVATSGEFLELQDDFLYTGSGDDPRKHLPAFDFEFVTDGEGRIIPVDRGNTNTAHPYWTWILGPGQTWSEPEDNGLTRVSFPFALVQRNSNCTHNGTMTFLFDDVYVSKVHYQITQETCAYFKFDMWGLLDATYIPGPVAVREAVLAAFASELANRMPTRPMGELAVDYPGTDLSAFGAGVTPEHMTAYGVVVDGVHYVSDCVTRYGSYPYAEWMRMPSYSTAKSFFAGVAMMSLAQQYGPGVYGELVRDHVPEAVNASGEWSSVTIEHASDMVVGNYQSALYMVDDGSATMDNEFYLVESHADKIAGAFTWPNKAAPGTTWVYHTGDTYILTQALEAFLSSRTGVSTDLFDYLVAEVFVPLYIGEGAHTSLRTSDNDWSGRAFGGYGLWFVPDDVAKIGRFLTVDGGAVGGSQILDPMGLAASLQQDPADRGYATTGSVPFMYNNGFWAKQFTSADGLACDVWVPFASGYGGITVALLPNGVTYYYFSDNFEYSWSDAVTEIDRSIASLDSGPYCSGGGGGGGSLHVADIAMSALVSGGNRWRAAATVTIVDEQGSPVVGATVEGSYTGSTSSAPSGTTDANGQVTLVSRRKKGGGTWTFCVEGISLAGFAYDSGSNVETCDSITAP